jgi:hypothetical protein
MDARNPSVFNRFRTLSIAMGVYTPITIPHLGLHGRTNYPFCRKPLYLPPSFFMAGRGVS